MTRVWVDFRIAATASLSGPSVRATMATSAPEAANRVATAKPSPLLPPVTMAVRPERLISIVFPLTPAISLRRLIPLQERARAVDGAGLQLGRLLPGKHRDLG